MLLVFRPRPSAVLTELVDLGDVDRPPSLVAVRPSPWPSSTVWNILRKGCAPRPQVGMRLPGFPFSSSDTSRIFRQRIQPKMLWTSILALLLLPLTLVSASLEAEHDKLIKLAAANRGVIKLDESTFNLLTHPKRTWSAAIQFTAMDKRRRCSPCKCVPILNPPFRALISLSREFGPTWDTVAQAWTKAPAEHRNSHFFATIDFDNAQSVFQRVSHGR